jgi:hypothetical protein
MILTNSLGLAIIFLRLLQISVLSGSCIGISISTLGSLDGCSIKSLLISILFQYSQAYASPRVTLHNIKGIVCVLPLSYFSYSKPRPGFEPGTCGLRDRRSTKLSYRGVLYQFFIKHLFKQTQLAVNSLHN